jgi:hypothetical protein
MEVMLQVAFGPATLTLPVEPARLPMTLDVLVKSAPDWRVKVVLAPLAVELPTVRLVVLPAPAKTGWLPVLVSMTPLWPASGGELLAQLLEVSQLVLVLPVHVAPTTARAGEKPRRSPATAVANRSAKVRLSLPEKQNSEKAARSGAGRLADMETRMAGSEFREELERSVWKLSTIMSTAYFSNLRTSGQGKTWSEIPHHPPNLTP